MSANDELQAHTCEKMLEFYGDVANNVAQANSQDLTEQYKNGKLKVGECYFIRLKSGKIISQMYSFVCIDGKHHCTDFGLSYGNVEEVLASVPSYEEWKELQKNLKSITDSYKVVAGRCTQLEKFLEEFNALDVAEENEALKTKLSIQCEANEELRKENQQLKELLLVCRKILEKETYDLMVKKIDNAIGEKK